MRIWYHVSWRNDRSEPIRNAQKCRAKWSKCTAVQCICITSQPYWILDDFWLALYFRRLRIHGNGTPVFLHHGLAYTCRECTNWIYTCDGTNVICATFHRSKLMFRCIKRGSIKMQHGSLRCRISWIVSSEISLSLPLRTCNIAAVEIIQAISRKVTFVIVSSRITKRIHIWYLSVDLPG